MLERDYLVTYNLSKESVERLYRKAENERLAKLIRKNQAVNSKMIYGFLGAVSLLLVSFLVIH